MKQLNKYCLLVLLAVCLWPFAPVCAQGGQVAANQQQNADSTVMGVAEGKQAPNELLDPNLYMGIEEANKRTLKMRGPGVRPSDLKSVLFTAWQRPLLEEAKKQMWVNRGVESYEKDRPPGQEAPRVKGPRELALGGIIYVSTDDWVVWLNGQRMTPDAIPKEVLDIKVKKNFIELRWYDSWTNLIFPVRLRPHQRFNLDSRIFLPGTSPS